MTRLAFTGDLLVYRSLIKKCKHSNGYDFSVVFEKTKKLLKNSDYTIGNLETPLAGKQAGYTRMDMLFNAPTEFARYAKTAGFDMMTTANNHCMDKGKDGIKSTILTLNNCGLEHTGTFTSADEKHYLVKEFDGQKIAFISYTYGINPNVTGYSLSDEDTYVVNLTKQADKPYKRPWYKEAIVNLIYDLPKSIQDRVHPLYPNHTYLDNVGEDEINNPRNEPYITNMLNTVKAARKESDFVVFCLHAGGQFNSTVGEYTKYLVNILKEGGADVIICNHPHCVLGSEWHDGKFVAYSLGNFTFTPEEGYFIEGVYGEYGIVLYLDVQSGKLVNVSFSIVKNIKIPNGKEQVIPVYDLFNVAKTDKEWSILASDVSAVISRFFNKTICDVDVKDVYFYNEFID